MSRGAVEQSKAGVEKPASGVDNWRRTQDDALKNVLCRAACE